MNSDKFRWAGYVLLAASVGVLILVIYVNNSQKYVPIIFSPKTMITAIWEKYKDNYIDRSTYRAIDRQRGGLTTSEAQSYSMLRAVWMDDHQTFDGSWNWMEKNLRLPDRHLYSWLYGQHPDGTFGVLSELNGQNTASDADQDAALALIFAYSRWKDPKYLGAAKEIVSDIWKYEIVAIGGKPFLASNDIERNSSKDIIINPSYLSPAFYKIFAMIDPAHDWQGVADSSYDVLNRSSALALGSGQSSGLPPDWLSVNRSDGSMKAPPNPGLDTNFSYDALRVPWRVALDRSWFGDPRAEQYLRSLAFLEKRWSEDKMLLSSYSHDGRVMSSFEAPSMYGGTIGAFMAMNKSSAKDVYENKLLSLYNPDINSWKIPLGYYDDNWAWFGIALYNGELPNLWNESAQ